MLFGQLPVFAATEGCLELGYFNGDVWQDSANPSEDLAELSVNGFNFTPSKDWMVAAGYTVSEAGTYDLTGSLLIDAETAEGVEENANAFDFMIF
jgi:hypothetical protein